MTKNTDSSKQTANEENEDPFHHQSKALRIPGRSREIKQSNTNYLSYEKFEIVSMRDINIFEENIR